MTQNKQDVQHMVPTAQQQQPEQVQAKSNLLFGEEFPFLNRWYRGTEVHVSPFKYYVVFEGREVGIYDTWPDAESQVKGFKGCHHKAYYSLGEAEEALKKWLEQKDASTITEGNKNTEVGNA